MERKDQTLKGRKYKKKKFPILKKDWFSSMKVEPGSKLENTRTNQQKALSVCYWTTYDSRVRKQVT